MDYGYRYNYQYNYPVRNGGEAVLEALLAIYLIVLTLVVIFALVSYIFHSIGLYTIGKRLGKAYPWLAFIPYARGYFQGELAGEITLKNKKIKNPGIWNLLIPIISSVLGGVFLVLILFVAGFGAAAGVRGSSGVGIVVVFAVMLYTLMLAATIALTAAQIALKVLINKQILERFTTGNMAIVHAVLTIAVPLYEAFCFFAMRNRDFNPGMGPKQTPPPALISPVHPGSPEPSVHPDSPEPPVHPGSPEPPGKSDPLHGGDVPEQTVQPIQPEDEADQTEADEEKRDEPQKTE